MKIKGLDGKEYILDTKGKSSNKKEGKSSFHLRARTVLKKLFPFDIILEEIHLPGCKTSLYLDFLLIAPRLAVEVQGGQHDEFVQFFHKHKINFVKSKSRDIEKQRWCELNKFNLVELLEDESDSEWKQKILTID